MSRLDAAQYHPCLSSYDIVVRSTPGRNPKPGLHVSRFFALRGFSRFAGFRGFSRRRENPRSAWRENPRKSARREARKSAKTRENPRAPFRVSSCLARVRVVTFSTGRYPEHLCRRAVSNLKPDREGGSHFSKKVSWIPGMNCYLRFNSLFPGERDP